MVLQGVSLEECAVGEGAVADGAGEGALHAVGAHVNIQRALLREALAADEHWKARTPVCTTMCFSR